jgi:hypothetical protein
MLAHQALTSRIIGLPDLTQHDLGCNFRPRGGHLGGWRHPTSFDGSVMNRDAELARIAERGKLDAILSSYNPPNDGKSDPAPSATAECGRNMLTEARGRNLSKLMSRPISSYGVRSRLGMARHHLGRLGGQMRDRVTGSVGVRAPHRRIPATEGGVSFLERMLHPMFTHRRLELDRFRREVPASVDLRADALQGAGAH